MIPQRPDGPPSAQHVFSQGNYDHALRCYFSAQDWAMGTGAFAKEGLHGIINRPHHEHCPSEVREVPEELIEQEGWNITVDFYCNAEALEWLKEQELPAMAVLVIGGAS